MSSSRCFNNYKAGRDVFIDVDRMVGIYPNAMCTKPRGFRPSRTIEFAGGGGGLEDHDTTAMLRGSHYHVTS